VLDRGDVRGIGIVEFEAKLAGDLVRHGPRA
jgi:hypothetical protein